MSEKEKSDFFENNLATVKVNLLARFGQKKNHNLNWIPNFTGENVSTETRSFGANNTHYVVPKINAVLLGRIAVDKEYTWKEVEDKTEQLFSLKKTDTSKTRNIDFWKTKKIKGKDYQQGVEVKKTTGCIKRPPVFIRSSKQQIEALLNQDNLSYRFFPSIYIVVSVDFNQQRKWILTYWCYPVKSIDDFMLFNTSDFRWKVGQTDEQDGWIQPS